MPERVPAKSNHNFDPQRYCLVSETNRERGNKRRSKLIFKTSVSRRLLVSVAEHSSLGIHDIPNRNITPQAVTGENSLILKEATRCMRNRLYKNSIRQSTYAIVRRVAVGECDEIRKGVSRGDGASSERQLVPDIPILPVIPDLVNHLHSRVVR